MYTIILYLHVIFFTVFFLVLLTRFYFLFTQKDEMLLLFSERARVLNLVCLIFIVVSGIYLGFKYDFSEGLWFSIKLVLLSIAVFVGDYAFKNFNRMAGVALLLILLYVVALSFTKNLDLIPDRY
jgi:uncharacterized membrane protein SirB2